MNEETKPVSIYEMPDGKKMIRIRTLDEDFLLDPKHIDNGETYSWENAMERLKEMGKDGFTKKQALVIATYHDEINKVIKEVGGDELGWEWTVSEYYPDYAWFYSSYRGTVDNYTKYTPYQLRAVYAVQNEVSEQNYTNSFGESACVNCRHCCNTICLLKGFNQFHLGQYRRPGSCYGYKSKIVE